MSTDEVSRIVDKLEDIQQRLAKVETKMNNVIGAISVVFVAIIAPIIVAVTLHFIGVLH